MPQFSEDEVTNFMVTEALVAKANKEKLRAQKDAEREQWRKKHKEFDPNAPIGG